ncbi:MAG: DUF3067 family protein [Leptolyngbya sp. SIO4C1]|nr:DUF3067 family protein [Leptolyngbya sp. SIO4C1]
MTGQELQTLLIEKWGYSYDVQLRKQPNKLFFQVMWRYLEQASFPMSEAEYLEHLSQIAAYLEAWGSVEQIRTAIETSKERPRLGKAVSIPIDLGGRASEWLVDL